MRGEAKIEIMRYDTIKCPQCGYVLDTDEDISWVSLWAEDGPVTCSCSQCETDFRVQEHVDRWYEYVTPARSER